MIASLPMYQRPELDGAHARYWALIRRALSDAGIDCPKELSQDADEFETWNDPTLVLSQTCGMPYRNNLHGRVTLVGTPDFGLDGCDPGWGRSAFVARSDDTRSSVAEFATAIFAYNQNHSQSGYSSPFHHVAERGFWFERRLRSGRHLESARCVADGRAEIAAIDAVTWRDIERYEPFAADLKVIGWTEPVPGLPYISRAGAERDTIFAAVSHALTLLTDDDRSALGIRGLVAIPAETYLRIENPPNDITATL